MGAITDDSNKAIKKLLKIASGMVAVGVALRIVAGANWASILSAAFAISTVMYALTGILFLMNRFADKKSVEIFTMFAIAMIPFGMAMKQMSKAVAILGNIEPGLVWNGFAAIAAFTALMLIVSKAADALSPGAFTLFSLSMLPFALAMETMAGVVATLALINPGMVWNGVAAITVFTGLMIGISRLSSILGSISLTIFSASMLMFGIAMEMMAAVIVTLAVLDYGKVWNGVAVVTVFAALLMGVSRLSSIIGAIGLTIFSASLIIFGLAMETMAGVIATLALLDYGKVWNGVAVIIVFTALMAGVSMLTNMLSAVSLTVFSASLMIFGAAMEVMAGVIATLALLEYGKVWNGVAVIGAFLAMVALAIKLIGIFSAMKFGVFAISLLKFGAAMSIMTANIVILGQMPEEQLTRGRRAIQVFIAVVALAIKLIGILSSLKLGVFAISLGMFGSAMMIMAGFLVLTYFVFSTIMRTKCGRVLVAIRDGENRARFSGYQTASYKTFVYVLSALFTAIAGALFVPFSGIISPSEMSISNSIDMAIWVAVGGRGTLIGGVIGAFLVNLTKTFISESFPEIWSYFIGAIFVVVVLFLPRGLTGVFTDLMKKVTAKIKTSKPVKEVQP